MPYCIHAQSLNAIPKLHRLVNTSITPAPPKFSKRVFVLAVHLGSPNQIIFGKLAELWRSN